MNLHPIDITIVGIYLLITLWIGYIKGRNIRNVREYAVGNKEFSTIVLVATIYATIISGDNLTGTAQKAFTTGLLFVFVRASHGFAMLFVSEFLTPNFKSYANAISAGEVMGAVYGKGAQVLTGITSFLYTSGLVGAQIGAIGYVSQFILGVSPLYGIFIGFGIVIFYTAFGGVRSVTFTDVFQFAIMLIAIPILCGDSLQSVGMLDGLIAKLKANYPNHLKLVADTATWRQYFPVLFVFCIPSMHPGIMQRLLMAKNGDQAKRAFRISGFMEFPMVMLAGLLGLIALVLNPQLNSDMTFPYLINNFVPIGMRGLCMAGIIAVIMSSADSQLNAGCIAFIHDVLQPIKKKKFSEKQEVLVTRLFSVVIGLLGIYMSLELKHLMDIVLHAKTFWMPIMVPPLLATLMGYKAKTYRLFLAAIGGAVLVFFWKRYITPNYSWDPLLPGMLFNALLFFNWWNLPRWCWKKLVGKVLYCGSNDFRKTVSRKRQYWSLKFNAYLPTLENLRSASERSVKNYGEQSAVYAIFMFLIIVTPFFMWERTETHYDVWMTIRIFAGALAMMAMLREKWPQSLWRWWPLFWHFSLMFGLPFMVTYNILDTGASLKALLSVVLALLFLVLLVDWRYFLGLTLVGSALGYYVHDIAERFAPTGTTSVPLFKNIPPEDLHLFFYMALFSLTAGMIFSRKKQEREAGRLESAESMAGTVAHEFQTPTAAISMIAQQTKQLLETVGRGETAELRLTLEKSLRNLEQQMQITHNTEQAIRLLLDNIKGSKRLTLETKRLTLDNCVQQALETFPFKTDKERALLKINAIPALSFLGNEIILIHTLQNLIKNALKAIQSAGKGRIKIWAESHERYHYLYVEDDAIGLDPRYAEYIFEKFTTLENSGTGLGLSFCKSAMQAIKGEIWCESAAGKYTRMVLRFPQANGEHHES
ncbi:MAG: hypothetical protein A2Y14_05590 [Verrucomicrobia bacterium GWF2_51_19]|nr:MAG: hypothetical protein A2Y14_05590 [Verrucomicrobia bacterium GWF2_51_19]